jgi:hypothetical protein
MRRTHFRLSESFRLANGPLSWDIVKPGPARHGNRVVRKQ